MWSVLCVVWASVGDICYRLERVISSVSGREDKAILQLGSKVFSSRVLAGLPQTAGGLDHVIPSSHSTHFSLLSARLSGGTVPRDHSAINGLPGDRC